MSQLVGCAWPGGVVLAADRRVVMEHEDGRRIHSLRKLYPLGTQAAIATAGAAVGIGLSRTLSRVLRCRSAAEFEEIEPYVVQVFRREYEAFVRQGQRWFRDHPEAHRRSYLLLAGRDSNGGCRLAFYASEDHGDPHQGVRVGGVVTAPRRLGLETRLYQELGEPARDRIVEVVIQGMRRIRERDDAVAGPFDIAVLDGSGFVFWTSD